MAKLSSVNKNNRRIKLSEKFFKKREIFIKNLHQIIQKKSFLKLDIVPMMKYLK